ncbi:PREDICTED: phosphoinositide phospholipase C 3-like [Populus euphratica]|uniref:Phosphoinositide phospholipase C 3-like n=1 Tax=Populus euphratica TaxID=75702 RepID=A0AAJ6TSE5_POPEU|nr:PREDICTED: phosphoinositide phospholipase C 3-like [Populus euphratica]
MTSSNNDPFVGWMHGAQMAAFNMQGNDKHIWIMQGLFNGGCGCVKKPGFSLSEPDSDPSVQLTVEKILKVKSTLGQGGIWIFATHFDLYSPPDFFVRVR